MLVVGISEYPQAEYRLRFAAKDARDLANAFRVQKGSLYKEVVVRQLTDKQATRDAIIAGLQWLRDQAAATDISVLFLAGHGITDSKDGNYYYLPYDGELKEMMATMVSEDVLRRSLFHISGKVLFFLDTCHAGKVFGNATRGGSTTDELVADISKAPNGVIVFAASTARQSSIEDEKWANGAFTKAMTEGLRGLADERHEGKVTITSIHEYVVRRVRDLTHGRQQPTIAIPDSISDFPIAVIREFRNVDVEIWR